MIPQRRRYIFIIVHYGNFAPTDALLKSLYQGEHLPDMVVVIDNGTEPYKAPFAEPTLDVFRAGSNDGYAAGINIGLGVLLSREVDENDIVICMNNDITIDKKLLLSLKKWWQENPKPALLGVKKGSVNLLSGRARVFPSLAPCTLPYLHGSFLSAPYGVFASLQGWPDQYFLYWEDVMLSRRAIKKGVPLKVGAKISIKHDDGVRQKYSDNQIYYLVRNGALFLEKETSFFWRKIWFVLNRLRYLRHKYFSAGRNKLVARALRDALRGVTGKRVYE